MKRTNRAINYMSRYTVLKVWLVRVSLHIYIYYYVVGYKIIYSVATLSYDNYYVNLRDYSNSLLSGLL
jgi:hypothetical protein